jgi:F-type H+-transporting ATPase subunit delta
MEIVTIARPYAEALYRLASQKGALTEWSRKLEMASAVASDSAMQDIISSPKFTRADVERVFLDIVGKEFDEEGQNLIRLLIENDRLVILPEIAAQFEKLKAEQSGMLEAAISSAFPLSAEQVAEMVGSLEKRFARKVTAQVSVDPELIGGVKINAGDVVIDASVRGQLNNMTFALKR